MLYFNLEGRNDICEIRYMRREYSRRSRLILESRIQFKKTTWYVVYISLLI